ncbi:hypothetical protein O9X98_15345 [Agrobacterium salinitolerans]|nr:hypothetical protein [Agrobacterium salinitolerans]
MAITRRELEYLVNHKILDLDDDTFARIAEAVLGKSVIKRARKYAVRPLDPAAIEKSLAKFPCDIQETARRLSAELKGAAEPIAAAIHAERRRFDKVLKAAERMVTTVDTRGSVSSAVTVLETALRDHGLCLPCVDGKVELSELTRVTQILAENERRSQNLKQKEATMAKLTDPQIDVLVDTLEGNDRFADRYAPALKVVALGLASWSQKSSGLSNDRLVLTEEGKARAELEQAKRKGA